MNEEIEEKIQKIVKIAEKCPEKYQEKCFEILLKVATQTPPEIEAVKIQAPPPFQPPIDVKAFLQQYNIPEKTLENLFLIHGTDIRPTYSIETSKKATAQIQIALLTALENALKTAKFEFSIESVRSKCIDFRRYDAKNFTSYFRTNKRLFKSLEDKEHIELSPDGKQELAEVILAMAK